MLYFLDLRRCKLIHSAFDWNQYELVLVVALYLFKAVIAEVCVLSYLQIFSNEITFPCFRINCPRSIVIEIILCLHSAKGMFMVIIADKSL